MPDNLIALSMRLPAADHLDLAINASAIGTTRNTLVIAAIRMLMAKLNDGAAAANAIAAVEAMQPRRGRRPRTSKPEGD